MGNPLNFVRFRSIAYLTGKGLVFGASGILPPEAKDLGKYAINVDVIRHHQIEVCDDGFEVFAPESVDFVFIGKRLEEMPSPAKTLKALVSKLKLGGHLVVHVNLDKPYDQTFTGTYFSQKTLTDLVSASGTAWLQKDIYEREGQILGIFKRVKGSKGITLRPARTRPQACIARYGAIGDMVMITPLIRRLHEDGYDVTLNITPYASPILEGNPYVSNIVHQERDAIPNMDLGEYWKEWEGSYDKYINLSESIEGKLLMVEGRKEFYTSKAFRGSVCNTNYYDNTMAIGGYREPSDLGKRGELYFTNAEERRMEKFFSAFKGKFTVLWALKGSSHHKMYPMMEPVMNDWLALHPEAHLITVGDKMSVGLDYHGDNPQVTSMVDKWTIRESMLATKYASVVVGPESAIVNGAACFPTPKITLLSHSTHENLCSHWEGDYCLAPSQELAPCYPCHALHYSAESCPLTQIIGPNNEVIATGPTCAMGAITGEVLMARLDEVQAKHWKGAKGAS